MTDERRGWWKCYYQFADKLLNQSTDNSKLCMSILYENYITQTEAFEWIDNNSSISVVVDNLIREYCNAIF